MFEKLERVYVKVVSPKILKNHFRPWGQGGKGHFFIIYTLKAIKTCGLLKYHIRKHGRLLTQLLQIQLCQQMPLTAVEIIREVQTEPAYAAGVVQLSLVFGLVCTKVLAVD